MAYNVDKNYSCSTRKAFLLRLYNLIAAGDANWSIIHEEGGYDSGAPADQDYFVLECDTAWGDGSGIKQQILFCARDATIGSATFGGAAGTKWTITDDSWSFVYSPDGGWNAGTKEFSDRVGSLVEKQVDYCSSTSATPALIGSIMTAPEALLLLVSVAGTWLALHVGALDSLDGAVVDARPGCLFWGQCDPADAGNKWGYDADDATAAGYVPNAARDGWDTACTMARVTLLDLRQTSKVGNAYVELPLLVFDSTTLRVAGYMKDVRFVSYNLTSGTEATDGTRISRSTFTFPWGN